MYYTMEEQYLALVAECLNNGVKTKNRTDTDCIFIFGGQIKFPVDLKSFPIITSKYINFDNILAELLWFISGSTNIDDLKMLHPTKIWDAWADENGDLGPIYGYQWKEQLRDAITQIKFNPTSRRIIVDCWQLNDLPKMRLAPCHYTFQFAVRNNKLDIAVTQRSCDLFLGVPYNLTSYALLLAMVAKVTELNPGYVVWNGNHIHIYENHILQMEEQVDNRAVLEAPQLKIAERKNILDFCMNDFELINYKHSGVLKGEVAV